MFYVFRRKRNGKRSRASSTLEDEDNIKAQITQKNQENILEEETVATGAVSVFS